MSVYFRHGSFLARWWDEFGNEHRKAFITEPEALEFERRARKEVARKRKEMRLRGEIQIRKVRDLTSLWLETKHPARNYQHTVAVEFSAYYGDLRVNQLNEIMVTACLDRWKEKGLAHNTIVLKYHTLLNLVRYFGKHGGPRDLELRKIHSYEPCTRNASVEEENRLYAASEKKPWLRLALGIFFNTGLRLASALSFAPCHYDRTRADAEKGITGMIRMRVKGGFLHTLPVVDDPVWHLPALLDAVHVSPGEEKTPYLELAKQTPIGTRRNFYAAFAVLKRRAHVAADLSPHALRRTFALTIYESSNDIRAVQKALGHKHLASTAGYLQSFDQETLAPIVAKARIIRITRERSRLAAKKLLTEEQS